MSTDIKYVIQLHRNGVITDGDLRKGIRMLEELSETPTEVPSKTAAPSKTEVPSMENKRVKRRKK